MGFRVANFSDSELIQYADPAFDQHFLVAEDKLRLIVKAAGIRHSDSVIEIGAGVGTGASKLPPCEHLTLVELDERLIEPLRASVPHAEVIHGDAIEHIK